MGVIRLDNAISTSIPVFGYEIIRDQVLSSILGKHEEEILYWAGKDLARKFPLFSMEEARSFFQEAGWGTLTLEKQNKDEATYILTAEPSTLNIEKRCFKLEAGFLAAQQQHTIQFLTECYEEKNIKHCTVTFKLKWDLKEPINKD